MSAIGAEADGRLMVFVQASAERLEVRDGASNIG